MTRPQRPYNGCMRFVIAAAISAGLAATVIAANPTREQAASFQKKLDQILLNAEQQSARSRQTTLSEGEVNAWLRFSAGDRVPTGVTDPVINIRGKGRLHGSAVVDLDVVRRKQSSGSLFDPRSYLMGRLPVTATGFLETHQGRGKFTLETATVGGVPIPKSFLQELLSYYSRSDDYPNGINMDDPFELPAAIQRIQVDPGRAVIFQ
jgi:hypothetical protein